MGWLPQSVWDEAKAAARAMTPEERQTLTWENARYLCPTDTLAMATMSGAERRGDTPWQGLCAALGIKETE